MAANPVNGMVQYLRQIALRQEGAGGVPHEK
jgi:hypothetical protein